LRIKLTGFQVVKKRRINPKKTPGDWLVDGLTTQVLEAGEGLEISTPLIFD